MSALIGKKSPCNPDRWCILNKPVYLSHSVVLIVDGLSLYHYLSNESKFEQTNKIFETRLEVVLPPCENTRILEELVQVPLTIMQAHELIDKHGSLESAVQMKNDSTLLVKAIFPIEPIKEDNCNSLKNLPPGDKFPRTKLLLSAMQMVDEGYPMPLRGEFSNRFKNYLFTKPKYAPVTDCSPMFAIDCEMCYTAIGYTELTRISIVNENLEHVYESLVMPTNEIVDYLTPYSGITPEIMKKVTKKLDEVQREVQELLPADAILVGQSLNFDLHAMKMMHPYVIDTSVCFNITGERKRKTKLQKLAEVFLKEAIQQNLDGHDSIEDSAASMKLVKMKLANSMQFGDQVLIDKARIQELMGIAQTDSIKNNLFAHVAQRDKSTAIISAGTVDNKVRDIIKKTEKSVEADKLKAISLHELSSNKEAIKKAREIAMQHALTITNLQIKTEDLFLNVVEDTMATVDTLINKLWKGVAMNGMFLVLMGGSNECPSGVAKIAIKKNYGEDVNGVSLND